MTVRRKTAIVFALAAMLLGAGCGGDSLPFSAETDEPAYREGQRLVKLGHEAEAMASFLKVIEKRGDQASPESHLEAGLIYLHHIKDPVSAIYHFKRYLELQPNSKQAPYVRGQVESAMREFARTLWVQPAGGQAAHDELADQVNRLQRENEALKAELDSVRSGTPPSLRTSRVTIDPNETATAPVLSSVSQPLFAAAPARQEVAREEVPSLVPPAPKPAFSIPGAPSKSSAVNAPAGRKHVVVHGDTLYSIAKKYGVTSEAVSAANHDLVPTVNSPLRLGVELKIP